ncbi:hypothetical protein VTN00DRAFT_4159 [Thermoascus crustaceus]|uniref:uncharacterized protein n=1 Tax=Thermoascus crustaceus TaxID=5088 RepID=UPI0037434D64
MEELELEENPPTCLPGGTPKGFTIVTVGFAQPRSKDSDRDFPLDGVNLENVSDDFLATLLDSALIIFEPKKRKLSHFRRLWR